MKTKKSVFLRFHEFAGSYTNFTLFFFAYVLVFKLSSKEGQYENTDGTQSIFLGFALI